MATPAESKVEASNPYGKLDASPTKLFFVSMLTRDISFEDAILDMLDNCVDGILRNKIKRKGDEPYEKYFAEIDFDKTQFYIHDNCGGIPWKLKDYAFRMGKTADTKKDGVPTVGVYGIGMKRAIFKMGLACEIHTQSENDRYEVDIKKDWIGKEDFWELDADVSDIKMKEDGTTIRVHHLHPGVVELFDKRKDAFQDVLIKAIETHYANIIEKGFRVTVNGKSVRPKPVKLAFSSASGKVIKPYIYKGVHDGVNIFLAVGFTRAIPDENEQQQQVEDTRYSSDTAGWTIVCNDRVVLYCDKSEKTGWGVSRVPMWHPQFIAVSGVVEFTSNDASKLPTITTKRGLDMGSPLYLQVRDRMIEGMKLFTDFTNVWKKDLPAAKKEISSVKTLSLSEIKEQSSKEKFKETRRTFGGKVFQPWLPVPLKSHDATMRRISFSRPLTEIECVADFIFEDKNTDPSKVGEKCFENMLRDAKKK